MWYSKAGEPCKCACLRECMRASIRAARRSPGNVGDASLRIVEVGHEVPDRQVRRGSDDLVVVVVDCLCMIRRVGSGRDGMPGRAMTRMPRICVSLASRIENGQPGKM